ncbi:carboxymuconolactone decarboxylase family protein [Pseudoduganella sp. SL102]|uniref:carboxymuconolactone decarboxylase family protein n=1 Tax=Pseudoduganella sp. SL102 TaxID=2995154 RepID=UPI00248B5DF4|nr:carboxymuconolactone decarboxylase family protein [Pseudoduganella sp. SL102]WBS02322.1 carboxymuconolactone decarboxylase family protein [Pseudoduganella sp. SL102]
MTDRLPPIAPEHMTPEQHVAAQAVIDGPRGALYGPFVPLLRSPELMQHAQRMGEYLRYRSALGPRLAELAILVAARHWNQQVEWAIHAPIAVEAGIATGIVDAIAQRRAPAGLAPDEQAVFDFCMELQRDRRVSDATYGAALRRFGEHGVTDLMGLCGYYTFLAMVMNAAQTAAPPSPAAPLPE